MLLLNKGWSYQANAPRLDSRLHCLSFDTSHYHSLNRNFSHLEHSKGGKDIRIAGTKAPPALCGCGAEVSRISSQFAKSFLVYYWLRIWHIIGWKLCRFNILRVFGYHLVVCMRILGRAVTVTVTRLFIKRPVTENFTPFPRQSRVLAVTQTCSELPYMKCCPSPAPHSTYWSQAESQIWFPNN